MSVVGIVLAAGSGSRMGAPKANLRHRGAPLITRAVRTAFAGGCDQVLAVVGAEVEQASRNAESAGAVVAVNEAWSEGMGVSLRVGLAAAEQGFPDASAALVLLVDQPDITTSAVAAVLGARHDPAALAAAAYHGRRGHPVLLGRAHWPALRRTLVGDVGARAYLEEHHDQLILVPCDALADPRDLDRPEDLDTLG